MFLQIVKIAFVTSAVIGICACGGGSGGTSVPAPTQFHCAKDNTCPEIMVTGDPFAETNMVPDGLRGYGDPSLEYDPSTGMLWLAYSWLNIQTSSPGVSDLGARTHLARSADNGSTFIFVRAVNDMEMESHPDTGALGWSTHEVPTIVREPDGAWQLLWLKYFNPFGNPEVDEREEFLYWRTLAANPEELGDVSEVWGKSYDTSESWGAPIDFNTIPELANCVLQTEPGLFAYRNSTYLATYCIVVDSNLQRRTEMERLVLLRQTGNGYTYVGNILDSRDANAIGVDTIEQADISIARDGSIILIVTPIILDADPQHQGCIVYKFSDFASAKLERDSKGVAIPYVEISADGNGLGPGLCTYDANSDTGIMIVISTFLPGPDIEFSLRATGIHP